MKSFLDQKTTVILVDDHPATIVAANNLLAPECNLLGIATSGKKAIDLITAFKPEVAVVDITMDGMSGFDLARHLRRHQSTTKIVFLTVMEDQDYARAARDLGASYVLKRRMHADLILSIKETMAGNSFVSPFS